MALKHIVLLKFRPEISQAQIGIAIGLLAELKDLIPGITGFAAGTNNSPKGLSRGFTHAFILTLTDSAARDAYLPHPEHRRVIAVVKPFLEEVQVFDFET